MKQCKRCMQEKPREEFFRLKSKKYKPEWDCRDSLCKSCRTDYQTERRRKIKAQCVEFLGGKCMCCGLVDDPCVYDFHHRDPSQKDLSFGSMSKSFDSLKEELMKCDLLCANCHRKRHYNLRIL